MITYQIGDATQPIGMGMRYIIHVCNSVGGWGRGFVNAISNRWPQPEAAYRGWFRSGHHPLWGEFKLGQIQSVTVEPSIRVINMIAQEGYGYGNRNLHRSSEVDSKPPIRYGALFQCLKLVGQDAKAEKASIHAPRIGCGLAGGNWGRVEPLLQSAFKDLDVHIYDLDHQ